jgi:hypothetical protein
VDRETYILLTRIEESLNLQKEKINAIENKLFEMVYSIEDNRNGICRIQDSIEEIDSLKLFLDRLENIEKRMKDREEKLTENTTRVNEMALELKGVISQTRAMWKDRESILK